MATDEPVAQRLRHLAGPQIDLVDLAARLPAMRRITEAADVLLEPAERPEEAMDGGH